ncbi:MAG: PASTA domain-containing protein, partial [Rikenellaceae bacterium]
MKKEYIKNPTVKSWLRTIAIATAILMAIVIVSIIYLAIYTRHGEHYTLPSLSGMTIEDAQKLTDEMEIRFDVIDSLYVEAMEPGVILDQYPKAGNFIKSGRRITITT